MKVRIFRSFANPNMTQLQLVRINGTLVYSISFSLVVLKSRYPGSDPRWRSYSERNGSESIKTVVVITLMEAMEIPSFRIPMNIQITNMPQPKTLWFIHVKYF